MELRWFRAKPSIWKHTDRNTQVLRAINCVSPCTHSDNLFVQFNIRPFRRPYVYTVHDDVTKWNHFPRYWPFVRGIPRSSPVISPHKGQWRGTLMFSLVCVWINGWVNNREAGDLRRHRCHYDVNVMCLCTTTYTFWQLVCSIQYPSLQKTLCFYPTLKRKQKFTRIMDFVM